MFVQNLPFSGLTGTLYVRQPNLEVLCTCEYKYIWCFAADFHFEIMITNAINQCERTLRPEKLWGKGTDFD